MEGENYDDNFVSEFASSFSVFCFLKIYMPSESNQCPFSSIFCLQSLISSPTARQHRCLVDITILDHYDKPLCCIIHRLFLVVIFFSLLQTISTNGILVGSFYEMTTTMTNSYLWYQYYFYRYC